jgi:molybdenum cofactor cytidylyltransferase
VGDQTLLTTPHLDALLQVLEIENQLVASFYDGRAGVPAAFPARFFEQLNRLHGDVGAQKLLRGSRDTVLIAWPEGTIDLDEPADVAALAKA